MTMKYILNEKLALRSWNDYTYALLVSKGVHSIKLKKKQFDILLKCDGQTELDENIPELSSLLKSKIIQEAQNGQILSEWQKHKFCNNPYKAGVDFRITGRCNFNCKHCFNAADMNLDHNQWKMSEVNKLLDEAVDCGLQYFKITGGEPMLHPDFLEIIREILNRRIGIKIILTNAYFLTQSILDELKRLDCYPDFYISFDCLGHHDWMRGKEGAEKKAIEAIKMCVTNGFTVLLDVQLNNITRDTLLETALFFDKMGVQKFRIIRTAETPRWRKHAGDACFSVEEYFDACTQFMKEYSKEPHNMEIICWDFGIFIPKDRKYRFNAIRCKACDYINSLPACKTVAEDVCISSDGTLYPCHQISGYYDSVGWKLPNVKIEGFQKALNNPQYIKDTQITALNIAQENEKCKACSHFKQCFGGCRTMSMLFGNGKYGHDPLMCAFYDGNYEQKIKSVLPQWTVGCESENSTYSEKDFESIIPSSCLDSI